MTKESGIETPMVDDFVRRDGARQKRSSEELMSKTDPYVKIAKMQVPDVA
jgi:hypothetical protein